jgi:hypothetical protein
VSKEGVSNVVPDLAALRLKWWQYLIVALAAVVFDVLAHVSALGFSEDGSTVSAVTIPIATAALVAMGAVPSIHTAVSAVQDNKQVLTAVAGVVDKIDTQTNGSLDERIRRLAGEAISDALSSPTSSLTNSATVEQVRAVSGA